MYRDDWRKNKSPQAPQRFSEGGVLRFPRKLHQKNVAEIRQIFGPGTGRQMMARGTQLVTHESESESRGVVD